jgi:acetyl-CoA carboxylase carboxyltransferase component
MAGQGFEPDFTISWPTGRMGVMEGEAAVQAVHGTALDKARSDGTPPSPDVQASADAMREDYEHQLDARYAAARGFVDAIIMPEQTRAVLQFLLGTVSNYSGPHLGSFVLPPLDAHR